MRELRDPQNGCQIGRVPLYGYDFCKTPSIRVELGLRLRLRIDNGGLALISLRLTFMLITP